GPRDGADEADEAGDAGAKDAHDPVRARQLGGRVAGRRPVVGAAEVGVLVIAVAAVVVALGVAFVAAFVVAADVPVPPAVFRGADPVEVLVLVSAHRWLPTGSGGEDIALSGPGAPRGLPNIQVAGGRGSKKCSAAGHDHGAGPGMPGPPGAPSHFILIF